MYEMILAQYHVVIDRTPSPDEWSIAAIIASIAVALLTGTLAMFTKQLADKTAKLANETQKMALETGALAAETLQSVKIAQNQMQAEDRSHQEALSPVVVMRGPRLVYQRGTQVTSAGEPLIEHQFSFFFDSVANIGFGPALNVTAEINIPHVRITTRFNIGTVERGTPITIGNQRNFQSISSAALNAETGTIVGCTVSLQYFNVFNSERTTSYQLGVHAEGQQRIPIILDEQIGPQSILTR